MAKKEINYNEAVKEIEEILQEIEENEIDIDIISEKVKRACFLIKVCKEKLHLAEKEVEKLFGDMEKDED